MDEQSLHTDTVHDWITGYLTNSLTPEEMQSFQEWLNASEENRKYFSDIQEVWIAASNEADDVHSFNKDRAYQLFLRRTGETTQQGINKRKAFQLRPWMYAAAMTIIVFICGTIAFQTGKSVIRKYGDIAYTKPYSVPTESMLEELNDAPNLIILDENASHILSLMTARQREWLSVENITAIYTLKYNRVIIGFLYIANGKQRPLTPDESKYLQKICYYFSYALRNANLYQNAYRASITDELTSLYNRKHAFECIDNVCQHQKPSTLIVLDIDDFKLYNELYGAQEGDNLIHRFAQIILQEITSGDIGFRFGADEFIILKEGTDVEEAKDYCKRIVNGIVEVSPANTVWDISVSCGISVFPDISTDAMSFLHNATQAVYYGKQAGKGKIEVYRHGMDERSHDPDIRTAYERVAPTIYALTAAIDAKDSYTFIHSMNVSKYAVILAESLDMNSNDIEIIRDAGLLHDIGKISIPERILQKTSRLTDEEYAIMKTHVENSTKMIRYLPDMDYVIPAVVGHHERYDGTGYPRGLAGQNIPYMARILTIADCFDAMTAKRPYKQALSVDYAVNELEKNSGTQFDPVLVKQFIELIHEGKISIT